MATVLRDLSYRYQWLYDGISRLAALSVGGEGQFRQLALEGIPLTPDMHVLDLCCGSGQATQWLVQRGKQLSALPYIVGLDASPLSIQRAKHNVPEAEYVEGWAEAMPFPDAQFDLVHVSTALHEMKPDQLRQILREVYRVLKPGGLLACIDFHAPTNPLLWPGLGLFLWLFETETAWQLIQTDLMQVLTEAGFHDKGEDSLMLGQRLYAGGSLQVIRVCKAT